MCRVFPILFGVLVASLVACEEEAIVHPPLPPPLPTAQLSAAAPVERPASEPTTTTPEKPAANTIPKSKMTLEALMEDYLEPLARKAMKSKQRNTALEDLLAQVAKMAPDDPKLAAAPPAKSWSGIVDAAVNATPPKYGQSCRQCHGLWRKSYKKSFHKREIEVVLPAVE